jgi:transposase-like protein
MAHPPEVKQRLRALYVHEGQGLEQAAQRLKVSPRTVSRWKQEALEAGDDWDKARAAALLAGEGAEAVSRVVLEEFLKLFQSTLEEVTREQLKPLEKAEAMSRLADAYTKTIRAIQKGAPELNRLAVASEVLQLLAKFVRDRFPAHAAAFMEVLEPFGEELVKTYG